MYIYINIYTVYNAMLNLMSKERFKEMERKGKRERLREGGE
jgi:hypothetical protein